MNRPIATSATQAAPPQLSRIIRADLHLHDEESRVPDERLGRLLGFSETWVTVERQRRTLNANGVELLTVTNHNNARACWKLLEAGHDLLPGAEFTCHFKRIDLSLHVLTYGFTPEQETRLNSLRHDALKFLSFCREHELPTTLAHPMHCYSRSGISVQDFSLLSILFDRFEVLNGQRQPWSNALALTWVQSFTPEKQALVEARFGLKKSEFCRLEQPALTGGSDDHFGLYTGGTTTSLDVTGLPEDIPRAEQARQALWLGKTWPSGASARLETLALGMLAYLAQLVEFPEAPSFRHIRRREGTRAQKAQAMSLAATLRAVRSFSHLRAQSRAVLHALQAPPALAADAGSPPEQPGVLAALQTLSDLPVEQKLEAQAQWARAYRRRLARDPLDQAPFDTPSAAATASFLWRSRRNLLEASVFASMVCGATLAQQSGRRFGSKLAHDLGLPPIDWQASSATTAAALEQLKAGKD